MMGIKMNLERILNRLGVYREARHVTLGRKQIIWRFNFLDIDFVISRVKSTVR